MKTATLSDTSDQTWWLSLSLWYNNKKLYREIEEKDMRIRDRCSDAFVMRGSYHILANQLRVGWHIDFYERLEQLLKN